MMMVMRLRLVKEGRRMARSGSSGRPTVLSGLPRWLTAFGIVLLVGELGAALLAGCAHGPARTSSVQHGGTPSIALPRHGTRTVVLRVDGGRAAA